MRPMTRRMMSGLHLAALASALAMVSGCERAPEPNATNTALPQTATATDSAVTGGTSAPPHPTRVFWGDTHLHTSFSTDAGFAGTRLTPDDAYRFARGETVTTSTGLQARLDRPLDFLAVADHSDGLGTLQRMLSGDPEILASEQGRRWTEMIRQGGEQAGRAARELISAFAQGTLDPALVPTPGSKALASAWQAEIAAAEAANTPGEFTALIAYEWTSVPRGMNMHRVVIYRDGADKASQLEPLTANAALGGKDDPRDLWRWLENYQATTGGQILAIPHNGNLSNGNMFPVALEYSGATVDALYAESRARWEPLYEVTQMKGDSEAHPLLSADDEFADFETWDQGNLDLSETKKPDMLQYEYAREALKNGLRLGAKLGTNPYAFGLIGATDSHTALTTAADDNYFGSTAQTEPRPGRTDRVLKQNAALGIRIMGWQGASGGYAGVWATGNSRAELFDALRRRETYATTGPRMTVRFFGGWDFVPADAELDDIAAAGYARGVPMGGYLGAVSGSAPSFLVAALKDPHSGSLDRIQIVKGWLDAGGATHERIYDVVWAGDRTPGPDGRLPPIGNTVDLANATWRDDIGAGELVTTWTDPDFDRALHAFYYARVLEIPTPRWTAYDAVRFGDALPTEAPLTTQERAYTSPIWYRPGS